MGKRQFLGIVKGPLASPTLQGSSYKPRLSLHKVNGVNNEKFNRFCYSLLVCCLIIWLAPCAGKMNQILHCDWLPEWARWSYLARLGLHAVSRKKNFPEIHIINPLLTKPVRSRWLHIGVALFCEFMDLNSVSVYKHAKKELGQYPAIYCVQLTKILTSEGHVFNQELAYPMDFHPSDFTLKKPAILPFWGEMMSGSLYISSHRNTDYL